MRSQSAIEFLSVYGFAILIISIMILLVALYASAPRSAIPESCQFYGGFNCIDLIYSPSSTTNSQIFLELSSTELGVINISKFSVSINNQTSISGQCSPDIIQFSGENVSCEATFKFPAINGTGYSGNIHISGNYCAYSSANIHSPNCPANTAYNFTGQLDVQASGLPCILPSSFPNNIIYYAPITITNNQIYPTPSNFEQMINVSALNYQSYEASNLQNVEFFYSSGAVIPSWLEGNISNESQTTSLSTSSHIVYWLDIANGITASNSITIFMGFAGTSNNLFNGGTLGEAPQLSSSYGKYDNGANIFNYYWNFAGTSLPSNFQLTQQDLITPTSSGSGIGNYFVNNGITITGASTANQVNIITYTNQIVLPASEQSSYNINGQSNGLYDVDTSGSLPAFQSYISGSQTFGPILMFSANSPNNYQNYFGIDRYLSSYWDITLEIPSSSQGVSPYFIGDVGSVLNYPTSFVMYATLPNDFGYNLYTNPDGGYVSNLQSNSYILGEGGNLACVYNSASKCTGGYIGIGSTNPNPITYRWLRVREAPPNGVMPTESFRCYNFALPA